MTQESKKVNLDEQLQWHCLQEANHQCEGECYLQKIFSLFGRKHSLPIIRLLLLKDRVRFNEIVKSIGGSPKTIQDRLEELARHGLLNREQYNEIPIRVEYSLTEPGKALEPMFEVISSWIKKWIKIEPSEH